MRSPESRKALLALIMSTAAFTLCFAAWVINGVLVTYLIKHGVFQWDRSQTGWLIGIPILTGSLSRLPVGVLTDKYGGRVVYTVLMLFTAMAMFLLAHANTFGEFALASLGFGLAGASFAVGITYLSLWFKREKQGTVLGVFGIGNIGAALTSIGAPILLQYLTHQGSFLDGWRGLPKIYGVALMLMAVLFFFLSPPKRTPHGKEKNFLQRLAPLKNLRVWRFGLYYFLVFGGFVGLAQWLIPYFVNVYAMPVATAGMLAALFSFPSGGIRAVGGWISDRWGARRAMYGIFGTSSVCFSLLIFPNIPIGIFTFLVFIAGIAMGIGMAAVYKHIPDYFPEEVGVVGGLVGVIGGLGGFFLPTFFGYFLQWTGSWSSTWIFLLILTLLCFFWMHRVVRRIEIKQVPQRAFGQ